MYLSGNVVHYLCIFLWLQSEEEKSMLKTYSSKLCHPVLFADESSIDSVLTQIETALSILPESSETAEPAARLQS